MTPEEIEELVDDLYTQFEELTRNTVTAVKRESDNVKIIAAVNSGGDVEISTFDETFEKVMSGLCGRFEWAR